MKRIQLLLIGFIATQIAFAQNDIIKNYYQLQRDIQFQKYMDNVGSKGLAGPNKMKFDYTMDKGAINEMVRMWEQRDAYLSRSESNKRNEDLKSRYLQKHYDAIRRDEAYDRLLLTISDIKKDIVKYYTSYGIPEFEAKNLSHEHVNIVSNKNNKEEIAIIDYTEGTLISQGLDLFNQKKNTAPFDELLGYVYMMSRAGYTAVKSLEYMETRFPEKKPLIEVVKPLVGINIFKDNPTTIARSEFDKEIAVEIAQYFDQWIAKFPEEIVESFENSNLMLSLDYVGNVYKMAMKFEDERFVKLIRTFLLHGKFSHYQKGGYFIPELNGYYSVSRRITRPKDFPINFYKKRFTYQDIVDLKKRFNINGVQALNLLGVEIQLNEQSEKINGSKFYDFGYGEEIKRLADEGDIYMQYIDAIRKVKAGNGQEKKEAYSTFKSLIDAGHRFPRKMIIELGICKKLGFDEKKFAAESDYKDRLSVLYKDFNHPLGYLEKKEQPFLLKAGDTVFRDWSSGIAKYKFEDMLANNNTKHVDIQYKDNAVFYHSKDNYRTWKMADIEKENFTNYIYEVTFNPEERGGRIGGIGIVLELNNPTQKEVVKQLVFRYKPDQNLVALNLYDHQAGVEQHLLVDNKNRSWIQHNDIKKSYTDPCIFTVRKVNNSFYFFLNYQFVGTYSDANLTGLKRIGFTTQESASGKISNISFVTNIRD